MSGLSDLPHFTVTGVTRMDSQMVLRGEFDKLIGVKTGPCWLYMSHDRSVSCELERLADSKAELKTDFAETTISVGNSCPYVWAYWQPWQIEVVLDESIDWRLVKYVPTDLVRFESDSSVNPLSGSVEAGAPVPDGCHAVKVVSKGWKKEACMICQRYIGPDEFDQYGYRDARDAAEGLNSKGPWICREDYLRYVVRRDVRL